MNMPVSCAQTGDDVIAAYRAITNTMASVGQDVPSSELDSTIERAADANCRLVRYRHRLRYAATAALVACMGLAVLVVRYADWRQHAKTAIQSSVPNMASITSDFRPGRSVTTSGNTSGLNNLILGADLAGANVRTTSAVKTDPTTMGTPSQQTAVNLNQRGVLDQIAHDRPYHYAIIRRILAGVDAIPDRSVGRWMQAQFHATNITYSPVLLTSAPPKRALAFSLESTHYEALLTLTPDGAKLLPLPQ